MTADFQTIFFFQKNSVTSDRLQILCEHCHLVVRYMHENKQKVESLMTVPKPISEEKNSDEPTEHDKPTSQLVVIVEADNDKDDSNTFEENLVSECDSNVKESEYCEHDAVLSCPKAVIKDAEEDDERLEEDDISEVLQENHASSLESTAERELVQVETTPTSSVVQTAAISDQELNFTSSMVGVNQVDVDDELTENADSCSSSNPSLESATANDERLHVAHEYIKDKKEKDEVEKSLFNPRRSVRSRFASSKYENFALNKSTFPKRCSSSKIKTKSKRRKQIT